MNHPVKFSNFYFLLDLGVPRYYRQLGRLYNMLIHGTYPWNMDLRPKQELTIRLNGNKYQKPV